MPAKKKGTRTPVSRDKKKAVKPAAPLHDSTNALADAITQAIRQTASGPNAQAMRDFGTGVDLYVGVRNVSSEVVGAISPVPGESELHLEVQARGVNNPRAVQIVTAAFWQQLVKGDLTGRGLIIRDDTVLGARHRAAPPDEAKDRHPDFEKNLVLDPIDFIEGQPEADVRTKIEAMTSEQSLRRLAAAVDAKQWEEIYKQPETMEMWQRKVKSLRTMPSIYTVVRQLVEQRQDDLLTVQIDRDERANPPGAGWLRQSESRNR